MDFSGYRFCINTDDYHIDKTGTEDVTSSIQSLIDFASKEKKILRINPGIYLISPLFLNSGSQLILDPGCTLKGRVDESKYKCINTRIAGIEMEGYPGLINIINCRNVIISGQGTIDGSGPYWWNKYWGEDHISGYRGRYDKSGLRWAADYDCLRPKNILVSDSSGVSLSGLTSFNSGFWNIHILYSHNVNLYRINIDSKGADSPSTDGIDIDSSFDVLVENCITSCNDDSICIKSGRDYDGYIVNRPSYNIEIKNCLIKSGFGITIGSEVSGGVHDVYISDITFDSSSCGFRIKSSEPRRGYIKDIHISKLKMKNVSYLFNMCLDWNPSYCYCDLPQGYKGEIPTHYSKLLKRIPDSVKKTQVSNIDISDVTSDFTEDYQGISRCFQIEGYADVPISSISFTDLRIHCKEKGIIKNASAVTFRNCDIEFDGPNNPLYDSFDNR